jgi:hypothetical protein
MLYHVTISARDRHQRRVLVLLGLTPAVEALARTGGSGSSVPVSAPTLP